MSDSTARPHRSTLVLAASGSSRPRCRPAVVVRRFCPTGARLVALRGTRADASTAAQATDTCPPQGERCSTYSSRRWSSPRPMRSTPPASRCVSPRPIRRSDAPGSETSSTTSPNAPTTRPPPHGQCSSPSTQPRPDRDTTPPRRSIDDGRRAPSGVVERNSGCRRAGVPGRRASVEAGGIIGPRVDALGRRLARMWAQWVGRPDQAGGASSEIM